MEAEQESPVKRAVLIDPGLLPGLDPLLRRRALGMLPVGGKPLIAHWCERLSDAGIREIELLLSHMPEQIRELVGAGERWGVEVHVLLVREDETPEEAVASARGFINQPTLVAGMHMLPLAGWRAWLQQAVARNEAAISTGSDNPYDWCVLSEVFWGAPEQSFGVLPCDDEVHRQIIDAKGLWQANMDVLSGVITDPNPSGYEIEPGVLSGKGCRLQPQAEVTSPCIIGENALIGKRVKLGPNVVIGAHTIVDEASSLMDCVIFDHTFIGSHTELDQAVVDGYLIVKIDSGVAVHVDDPMILGNVETMYAKRVTVAERLVAFFMLALLSVPMLLRAILLRLSGKQAWESSELLLPRGHDLDGRMSYHALPVHCLAVANPMWRKLPWLWHVVLGRLALTGAAPSQKGDEPPPEWAHESDERQVGVICLADVSGASRAGHGCEEALIADSYYCASRKGPLDLMLASRLLANLWRPWA
ncbi:MAG: sugar phosphate nucleotidyltransferase [Mariprofundaceae bacterium]